MICPEAANRRARWLRWPLGLNIDTERLVDIDIDLFMSLLFVF